MDENTENITFDYEQKESEDNNELEEDEYDINFRNELFYGDELEDDDEEEEYDEYDIEFYNDLYNTFDTDYSSKKNSLSERDRKNVEVSLPLEEAIRKYCTQNEREYGIQFKDLTKERNFKNRKGIKQVDFIIDDIIGIEAKNWNCFAGKGYAIIKRDMRNQVILKFEKYPNLRKVLIIGKPNWKDGKEYLLKNNVHIIELGFQVNNESLEKAYGIIKTKLDEILYIPYLLLKYIV